MSSATEAGGGPDVSVVVVSYDTCDLTRACLRSLADATRGCSYELLVVDNASSDGSAAMVEREFPDATLIRNDRNLGFAAACNQALKRARGSHWMLLNSDARLDQDVLSRLLAELEKRPQAGLVAPSLHHADGSLQASAGRFPSLRGELGSLIRFGQLAGKLDASATVFPAPFLPYEQHAATRSVDWVAGAAMLVRGEAGRAVGLLDEGTFFFAEDWDWCRRFRDAGWDVVYVPEVLLLHVGEASRPDDEAWRVRALLAGYRFFFVRHGGPAGSLGFRVVTAIASTAKSLVWSLLGLVNTARPAKRSICVRRLLWNLRSVAWALRPGPPPEASNLAWEGYADSVPKTPSSTPQPDSTSPGRATDEKGFPHRPG